MTTDREILKRLFKIAKNQQKILNKLAAYPALEQYIKTTTYAWLANVIGQSELRNVQQSTKFLSVEVTQDPVSGKMDALITFTPENWDEYDIQNLQRLVEDRKFTNRFSGSEASSYENYLYEMLGKQKGISPQNIRIRPFVVVPAVQTNYKPNQQQEGQQPKSPSGEGMYDKQDPTNLEKIKMRPETRGDISGQHTYKDKL